MRDHGINCIAVALGIFEAAMPRPPQPSIRVPSASSSGRQEPDAGIAGVFQLAFMKMLLRASSTALSTVSESPSPQFLCGIADSRGC